jgi:hypothetical protein
MERDTEHNITTETISHLTDYLLADPKILFDESSALDWLPYAVNREGQILFRAEVSNSVFGLQGTLSLMIPPRERDVVDAWEGNKFAGQWDCWACLILTTSPASENQARVSIAYELQSFFDADGKLVKEFTANLQDDFSEALLYHYDAADDLRSDWENYLKHLKKHCSFVKLDAD